MSDRYFDLRRESGHIPSGRQLPRTPPSTEVIRRLDFSNEDPEEACETVKVALGCVFLKFNLIYVIITVKHHLQLGPRDPEESELSRSSDLHMLEPRPGPPHSRL